MLHVIPYKPRAAFLPFHQRTKRWSCLVAHRRAGKTVAAINDLIRAAVTSKSPMPQFAYIAPFRSQAKSVAWDYLKHFSATSAASTMRPTPASSSSVSSRAAPRTSRS
jgi:hypothetical protein